MKTTPTTGGETVAEQLRICAYVDELGKLMHTDTQRLESDIALTPHAPAQSALDELRREVETLRADRDRLTRHSHGQLDPRMAYETAQEVLRYVDAFNGQEWSLSTIGNIDRKNLAVALDHLQNVGAMLLNQSDRLRAAIDTARASTDEGVGK